MLFAAAIVSCNNEVIGPDGGPDGTDSGSGGGESTTATFSFKLANPGTYSGTSGVAGSTRESELGNVGMFIYDEKGTPEAMAYVKKIAANENKVTVRCKSGTKLIYVAANFGVQGTSSTKLIDTDMAADDTNVEDPLYMGVDWTASGTSGPLFSVLNRPVWAANNGISIDTANSGPTNTDADNLIKALTGNGDISKGVLSGDGSASSESYYLMSNWGDNSSQVADTIADGTKTPDDYDATVKFVLEGNVSAADSRISTNKNYVKINIQRAVAKIAVKEITPSILDQAGSGTNAGTFELFGNTKKWAVGNINSSTYPFQMWDGGAVRSTRYNDTATIIPKENNQSWAKKMDNTRIEPTGQTYEGQNLKVGDVLTKIESESKNLEFLSSGNEPARYSIVTENNNKNTYSHYTTYVMFGGTYKPNQYVLSVSNVGGVTYNTSNGVPTDLKAFDASKLFAIHYPDYGIKTDTMYYVSTYGTDGMFFLGDTALFYYVAYSKDMLGGIETDGTSITKPFSSPSVVAEINRIGTPNGSTQAALQKYYKGQCLYRVWLRDNDALFPANKSLVRRNHTYVVEITNIKGPGIADPNDIIDPTPDTIEPLEESDTYVTAEINVMNWHIIDQKTELDLK